ncbi:MAG: PCMD domain-containing protein [Muribaculaceae bacterium]|nr:PCMD domain-containing protein [Muribaculaceae bacterium]
MAHRIIKTILAATAAAAFSGCIVNDIPYPRIQANIVTFEVEGQDRGALVDSASRSITVYLPEQVDIENVRVTDYTLSADASLVGDPFAAPLNLSSPIRVEVHLYADWTWTISAEQTIERYFTVAGQVGPTEIDVPGRRVVAYVSKSASLKSVLVESIKLAPDGGTMTPDIAGQRVDFTKPYEVLVEAYGRKAVWTIFVENTDLDVATERADAWTNVAWVYGRGTAGLDNGIEYRLQGTEQWTRVDEKDMYVDGGNFYARILHLDAETTYETRAFSGQAYGETLTFTTGTKQQMPNSSFDDWWKDGKIWCPWAEDAQPYWGTGNKGAATLGESNSVPTEDTSTGTGWAAMLQTKFIGIGAIGKPAAGNIFVGSYVRTDGTNGVLSFGREFHMRPTRMRGYLKYKTAPINYAERDNPTMQAMIGQPDTCTVWIALIDTDEPFEIRTNPKNRQLFDPQGDYVVAYGAVQYGEDIPEYIPFEFELDYRSTSRVPNYILVTASASKYGDYFTCGAGAVLYIDDLELLYDY